MTSDLMVEYGKGLRSKRPLSISVVEKIGDWSVTSTVSGGTVDDAVTLLEARQAGLKTRNDVQEELSNENESGGGGNEAERSGEAQNVACTPEETETVEDEAQETETACDAEVIAVEASVEPEEKAGRRLSASTQRMLMDVKGDLEELMEREELSRGGGAICERCIKKLDKLCGEDHEEESVKPSVKDAIAIVLSDASAAEQANLLKLLQAFQNINQKRKDRNTLRAIVAGR